MDVKEYIASGIIERYALGSVSPQEKQEVECMSHIYPEIKQELESFQSALEQVALKTAVTPPEKIRASIFERIKNEEQLQPSASKDVKVVKLNTTFNSYKYAVAASIVVVLGLSFFLYSVRTENDSLQNQLAENQKQIETLSQEKQNIESSLNINTQYLAFIKDEATTKVMMNGTEAHPGMLATVFWNTNSKEVMLEVNNLPIPPEDKQYQLWAIVDGVPKDMGVLDITSTLIGMKSTSTAQAFAITLEPKGGSASPTLEQMYVLGNV
jgi:anti-sigma-K factor RskA